MKKTVIVSTLALSMAALSKSSADVLLDYTFEGSVLTPATQAGLTGSNFSYNGSATPFFTTTTALNPVTRDFGGVAYGTNGWPVGTDNTLGAYFAFSLTATDTITLDSLTFDERRSNTGPIGGTQDITIQISTTSDSVGFSTIGTIDLTFDNAGYNNNATATGPFPASFLVTGLPTSLMAGQSLWVRIYASNAEGSTGTFTMDNVTINGTAPVPEPGTVALLGLGLGTALFGLRRRRA